MLMNGKSCLIPLFIFSWTSENINELCHEKTCLPGFRPGLTQIRQAVQSQEMTSCLKILDIKCGGIVLCNENEGADKLRGYHAADLRLCFRIYKKQAF